MKVTPLSYKQTGFFSQLIADYLDEHTNVAPLYSFPFTQQGFEKAIAYRQSKPVNRAALVAALEQQYKQGNTITGTATAANIQLLKDDNTFTIVTGHQLCLFTGPLYLIYKLADCISLARQLKEWYPQHNFVPVYWMHTEDGDVEEINHAYLFNKKITWDADQGAAGMLSTETLQPVIDEVAGMLGDSDNAKELLALIKESYLNHSNLADAMRHFVNALMGEYGLVILDPNNRGLKAEFASIITEDLAGLHSYHKVNDGNAKLAEAGYGVQVNPREVNLFYINNGQRYRLVKTDTGFATAGNEFTFSKADIDKLIAETPEVFSPNVVLRPLYQEVILPNICYVGGGGELAYWLQYKAFSNHYGYELPVLALRSSYMLVDEAQAARIEKFGFSDVELFESTDALIKRYLQNAAGTGISFDAERSEAAAFFQNLSAKTAQNDPTLVGSIEAENKKLQNYLAGLEAKLLKAQKNKEEATVNQIRKLKESLFPNDTLQERYANFIPWYLKYGSEFFKGFTEKGSPLSKQFFILRF